MQLIVEESLLMYKTECRGQHLGVLFDSPIG